MIPAARVARAMEYMLNIEISCLERFEFITREDIEGKICLGYLPCDVNFGAKSRDELKRMMDEMGVPEVPCDLHSTEGAKEGRPSKKDLERELDRRMDALARAIRLHEDGYPILALEGMKDDLGR